MFTIYVYIHTHTHTHTHTYRRIRTAPVAQWQRIYLNANDGRKYGFDPGIGKEMETYLTILAWESPWTGEPGGL